MLSSLCRLSLHNIINTITFKSVNFITELFHVASLWIVIKGIESILEFDKSAKESQS